MTTIEELLEEVKQIRTKIGNHDNPETEISDRYLSIMPNDTLTGQAYEDLAIAYSALGRFIETVESQIQLKEK